MIIRKYRLVLKRLQAEDIELVRMHRNSDEIRPFMFHQEMITPQMQKEWFSSINNPTNHYFLIEYQGKKIGLIFGKEDDYVARTTESGIFIWDKNYLNSLVPVLASVLITELTFTFREMKKIYATVQLKNQQVINYITELGYKLEKEIPSENKRIYSLTKENYFSKATRIKKAIGKLCRDFSEVSAKDIDVSEVSAEERRTLYASYPLYLQKKFDELFKTTPPAT